MNKSTSEAYPWWGGWTGQRRHENGFRLNAMDLLLAVASVFTSWVLHIVAIPLWWAPAYLFITFFIFCNVLRITRRYELIWCGAFVATSLSTFALAPALSFVIIPAVGTTVQLGIAIAAWHSGQLRGFRNS